MWTIRIKLRGEKNIGAEKQGKKITRPHDLVIPLSNSKLISLKFFITERAELLAE